MIALLQLAAETAKDEPSKTPFFIAGGALAAWAVIVSFLGITRPDFPPGKSGRAAVIALSIVLVLGATSTAVITS
jgi:hypothetical protein